MKIADMQNFTVHSVVNVTFDNLFPEDMQKDDKVLLALDSASRKYYMDLHGCRYDINPTNSGDRLEMDSQIAAPGLYLKYYVGNIDNEKRSAYIYVFKFVQHVSLAAEGKLQIKIPDNIMEKVPKKVTNIVSYLSSLFLLDGYNEKKEAFAIKKLHDTERDDFVLVSSKKRLDIKREGNEYVITNLVNYSHSDSPMIVLSGHIEFVDQTQSARINEAVAACLTSATDEGKYTAIWRQYDNLENLVCVRKAFISGVYHYSSYTTEASDVMKYIL